MSFSPSVRLAARSSQETERSRRRPRNAASSSVGTQGARSRRRAIWAILWAVAGSSPSAVASASVDARLGRARVNQLLNEIHADAVVLDARLKLGQLRTRLVEVEDRSRTREVQQVSVFERPKEEAGFLRRFVGHCPIAHGAVEVKLEQWC